MLGIVVGTPQEQTWWEKSDPQQNMTWKITVSGFAGTSQPNSSFQHSSYSWGSETRGSWPQECKELDNMITAALMSQGQ